MAMELAILAKIAVTALRIAAHQLFVAMERVIQAKIAVIVHLTAEHLHQAKATVLMVLMTIVTETLTVTMSTAKAMQPVNAVTVYAIRVKTVTVVRLTVSARQPEVPVQGIAAAMELARVPKTRATVR